MIVGIGVDMVSVKEIERLISVSGEPFLKHTFTPRELESAQSAPNQTEYLSERFAAKEAFFKAIQHSSGIDFDLRLLETLNYPDGQPYCVCTGVLQSILVKLNVNTLHITLTSESGIATAFVIAEAI